MAAMLHDARMARAHLDILAHFMTCTGEPRLVVRLDLDPGDGPPLSAEHVETLIERQRGEMLRALDAELRGYAAEVRQGVYGEVVV